MTKITKKILTTKFWNAKIPPPQHSGYQVLKFSTIIFFQGVSYTIARRRCIQTVRGKKQILNPTSFPPHMRGNSGGKPEPSKGCKLQIYNRSGLLRSRPHLPSTPDAAHRDTTRRTPHAGYHTPGTARRGGIRQRRRRQKRNSRVSLSKHAARCRATANCLRVRVKPRDPEEGYLRLKKFIVRAHPCVANERMASTKTFSRSGIACRSSSVHSPST